MFNKLLLVSCVCIVVALILYFFHWNRFVGFLIGRFIRLMYWNEEASSIWVEIGSIHFSLIAGRILLKDVSYHSSNQTVKIVKGQIQWRYWIRRPTTEDEIGINRGGEDQVSTRSMHCRIHVSFQGFEWFLYNRTAAYDNIIEQMEANSPSRPVSRSTERRQSFQQKSSRAASVYPLYPPSVFRRSLPIPNTLRKASAWLRGQLPNLDPKDLLPLGIEVIKGAITCGNSSTPNLLVAEFQRAEGTFGIVESRSRFDLYKQLVSIKFQHALVRYVENENYADPMTSVGGLVHGRIIQYSTLSRASSYLSYRSFDKLWDRLGLLALAQKYTLDRRELHAMQRQQNAPRPHKKSQSSPDNTTPIGADFTSLEYAIQRKILEAPVLELTYYFDVVGLVPTVAEQTGDVGVESIDIGNGDVSPEWGFDITVSGGLLRYGPWADRQRAELQKAFFPPTYYDAEATSSLKPGDRRLWTAMRIFIELRDNTTLQVPFREPSKDWQWDGKHAVPHRQRVREPAAIHVAVGDRSSISYTMPMVAGSSGYHPILEVHLDTVAVTSSLNDIRLVSAESCRVHCELPSPLKWNMERRWIIAVSLRQPVLFLVRDHINMFIDLGKDWTTAPPADYQRFVPMVYAFEIEMHHYELNLYANDHNIIDKPLIRDENALVTARGSYFHAKADILSNKFRPESTTIPFSLELPDVAISLSLPRWNTNALYAPKEGNSLAKARIFCISGSYQYFAEVQKDYVEQLKLRITLHDIALRLLGWSIRYCLVLRDNYLGSFTHFSTLYEYLDRRKRNLPPGDPIMSKYRPGKANVLQVDLQVFTENGTIIMPAGLPGYESTNVNGASDIGIGTSLVISIPEIQLQLRIHDYYMEMSLNVGVITGGVVSQYPETVTYIKSALQETKEIFVIDGLDITANRLFGPQPRTATYVCIWEIHLGSIKALLSASEGRQLLAAGNAFRLNYADFPNAPATEYLPPVDPDVTFVKLSLCAVNITWRADHAALLVTLPFGVNVDSNDLGGRYHRKVTSVKLPEICVKVLLTASTEENRWLEAADVTTDAYVDIYSTPHGYRALAQAQIAYVEDQDRLTGRARHMFGPLASLSLDSSTKAMAHSSGLYLPHPVLPNTRRHTEQGHVRQSGPKDRPQKPWPLSSVAQLSDSDAEDGISEADRDARLAKTRTSTPIPRFTLEEDQNMTSGDESDNEDLTDASSDSDWFDLDDDTNEYDTDKSLLRHYSHVTRHYIAGHLGSPELWAGCPFVLVRDRTPSGISQSYSSDKDGFYNETSTVSPRPTSLGEDRDTTSVRLRCTKALAIKITPLILPAAIQFEEDLKSNPLGPELCIDAMMVNHLGSLAAARGTGSCTLFEVSLPSVAVRVLQRIVMTDGHPTISRDFSETDNPNGLDVIAVAQATVGGIFVSGILVDHDMILEARVKHISLTLDMSIDKRTIQPATSNEFVFGFAVDDFRAEITQDGFDVRWGESVTHVGHHGPEYLTATSIALIRNATQLAAVTKRWKEHSSSLRQNIVSNIIRYSEEQATIDPLSTIQPSYLVQSGTPHLLRTDTIFKLLYHLRNCLWHLEDGERSAFRASQNNQKSVDLEDFYSALESRLVSLDPDAYNMVHMASLEKFFPVLQLHDLPSAPPSGKRSFRAMSLRIGKMVFVVLDPACGSPSELVITDVFVGGRMQKLEVLQLPSLQPTSISQTSLREKRPQRVSKTSTTVFLGDITLSVFPHLMHFAQHILRVRRHYHSVSSPTTSPRPSQPLGSLAGDLPRFISSEITFSLRRLRIQAAAENLVFELGVSGVRGTSSLLLLSHGQGSQSMSHSVLFNEIYIQARSPADMAKQSDQDILASLELTDGKFSVVLRKDLSSKNLGVVFSIGGLRFHVPRSALRLYRFVEEWRADFLPGIEATIQALLSELQRAPTKPPPTARSSARRPTFHLQGQLSRIGVTLQVMHGTWLALEANNNVAFFNSPPPSVASTECTFGLQVASMALSISSKPSASDTESTPRVKLVLPPLSATGRYDGNCVNMVALIDFIELKLKPSHWDTLLVVQQKFGQDFNDLVLLAQETHLRGATSTKSKPSKDQKNSPRYSAFLKIRGFRVGLEGLSSTMYLECLDIGGGINNTTGLAWNVDLSDLAFSLAPRTAVGPHYHGFNRNHRSAFVIVDFKISASDELVNGSTGTVVQILVTKMHAVMQPSSIGEVGDFIDHLQAEMLSRKDQRALELAAFKEKTQSILKTFEVGVRDIQADEKSWLEDYIINVSTRNIGVAFPLTHDPDLEIPQMGSRDSSAVRAFLWSIKSIEFGTYRGETGQATMKSFSFQFVSRFRQSVPSDFSGENHQTRNKLVYPEMEAQLRSTRSASSRHIWMGANVSGFILDLDSNIPSFVFSLIDVYRQGKERVDKLSSSVPYTPSAMATGSEAEKEMNLQKRYTAIPTSSVFASLTFLSGKVRVYSGSASNLYRARTFSLTHHEPSDEQIKELGAEVFNLPVVSVWTEYRATPASRKLSGAREAEPSILMFKSTVHSSQNTLRPTLLPFLTELVSHIETRLRKVSMQAVQPAPTAIPDIPRVGPDQDTLDTVSSMRISFSLRIDQSKLELTCQPDVNVVAGVHWESGGFVVNVSPGARKVTFTGSVGGLTVGLKHGFLSEDCAKLDARNLAFSVTFAKIESETGASIASVSVILDTEFLGVVRFSRLQDILCFKAVWLDRIPVFNSQSAGAPKSPSTRPLTSSPSTLHSAKQEFSTVVLVRVRQITLDVDLGQSISAMTLDLKDAVLRTKLTEVVSEVSVFVADLALIAKGNVAGHAHVARCVFQTIRSTESTASHIDGKNRMLELRMTSGPLVVSLESDHQKLLHYRAEPLEVRIFDDWSVISSQANEQEKPLQLSFTVMSPEIIAAVTVGTIPKLLAYVNKFQGNLDAQRQGASRESKAFRVTRTPKPDNPLSSVAEAMLHSARSRFKEADNGLTYVIMQHMSLQLDFLRLIVFPRTMNDLEIAQFTGRDVRARLDRLVESELVGKRDLLLSFSSLTISKFTGLGHPQVADLSDGREWLTSLLNNSQEAIIVGLPSMTMHMVSEETVKDLTTILVYDFHSKFVRQEGTKDFKDIYITLNVALYSWLTILRKNLTREMDQVKATTDWRVLLNTTTTSANGGAPRKKAPEPLSLVIESPESSPALTPGVKPFSPFSPTTALKSSMPGVASATSSNFSDREGMSPGLQPFPSIEVSVPPKPAKRSGIIYQPRSRHIERLTMRQLGEATPDVMHPFFMKKAGFNLEDSLPQYVNEYATAPLEEIMEVLLKLYSRQLLSAK
ncbi:Protein CSF1 [Hypsizygus marmoreus]|uniref:Protein CSF1 n=1 Tax=Hypsizygus marmoreus TaxID=39966 RepID=A0A369K0V6_HYPMA|nr:Protein CSF1 [Hypsizygus marmoreus]